MLEKLKLTMESVIHLQNFDYTIDNLSLFKDINILVDENGAKIQEQLKNLLTDIKTEHQSVYENAKSL